MSCCFYRAILQSQEVFQDGIKGLSKIGKELLTALGTALFAGAHYEEAAHRCCEASDLSPANPEPLRVHGQDRDRSAQSIGVCR